MQFRLKNILSLRELKTENRFKSKIKYKIYWTLLINCRYEQFAYSNIYSKLCSTYKMNTLNVKLDRTFN